MLRTDKKARRTTTSSTGRRATAPRTDKAFADADVVVKQDIYIPRIHVASIETCGCVADFDRPTGKLTVYMTTQAPHAIRTVFALVAGHVGLSEEKIRIISPDIGGGFGGKVPVYPGLRHRRRRLGGASASRSSGSRTAWRTCRPTPSPATTT